MGQNTLRTLKVLELLKDTDEDHPKSSAKIIEELDTLYGIRAERKAIGRDIADLKSCGYYVELRNDDQKGWYYDHKFEDWEIKVLIDAVQSAKFLTQANTDALTERLCGLAGKESRKALRRMTIPADSKRGDPSTKDAVQKLLKAITRCKKVQFNYVHTDEKQRTVLKHPEGTKPVSPYALIWRKDKYYLIGSYDGVNASYYRLDRIRNLKVTEETAIPLQEIFGGNAEQKLRAFVKKNIYNKKGKEVRLQLQLMTNGVDTVMDSFGEDVRVLDNGDGTVSAYVTVTDSEGLYTWLMHHAGECAVIKPETVREEMRRRLKTILDNYS